MRLPYLPVMLLAGYRPGPHTLTIVSESTGDVLFEDGFELTTIWPDDAVGPSTWFVGAVGNEVEAAAWGGGQAGPQNIDIFPAMGTRRLAIVLVDTASQRYTTDPTELDDLRNRWLDLVLNGIDDGGVTVSVRQYYREVSFDKFDISAEIFGPFQLSGEFEEYIHDNGKFKGGYPQAVITAADGAIDYNNIDTVVCVLRGVDGPTPVASQGAHPMASRGDSGPMTTADGDKKIGIVSMPHELLGQKLHTELIHELGHNLRLADQYRPLVTTRNLSLWDPMDRVGPMPHFCLAHRMMLGWIEADWVRSFDFQSIPQPVDEVLTLHPVAAGAPPGNQFSGIEIRIADGWNYYFEYRGAQAGQIGDQNLPEDGIVLVTDVQRDTSTSPITRPWILLAPQVGASQQPVLSVDEFFEQDDTTTPDFPVRLRVTVQAADADGAQVRVQYGVVGQPDPSIRPWPAAPDRRYQSPDIEVQNARTQSDPAWFNTPWQGEVNDVIARIKNRGTVDAPGVTAIFSVKDLTVGDTPETVLGTDTNDIPAGDTVEFQVFWQPPREGHFCLVVRVPLYQTPGAASVVEMTELNNRAQSNYDRFISDAASPAVRRVASIAVANPFAARTRVFIVLGQDNPLFRTYLEHQWLALEPGETRQVEVMMEYAGAVRAGDLFVTDPNHPDILSFQRLPNRITFSAYIEDPGDDPTHAMEFSGGTDIEVVTARATRFDPFKLDGKRAGGRIVTCDTGEMVTQGKVIIITTLDDDQSYKTLDLADFQAGVFEIGMEGEFDTIRAYYAPAHGFGDAYSDTIQVSPV